MPENYLPIIKEPAKILRNTVKEIPINAITSPKIRELILKMKETLKHTPDGVGLAAPQVGKSLRIFIISEEAEEIDKAERNKKNQESKITESSKNTEKPYEIRDWKYYVFINPTIKNISKKKLNGPEGCLSVPKKYGEVKRYEKITVEAYDEYGKKFTRGASKFFARVMQHELDHLSGTLYIDKAENMFEPDAIS